MAKNNKKTNKNKNESDYEEEDIEDIDDELNSDEDEDEELNSNSENSDDNLDDDYNSEEYTDNNSNDSDNETNIDDTENKDDNVFENNELVNNNNIDWHYVSNDERITDNFLSDYEFVNCLAIRTKQITLGAKILLKNADELRKLYTPKQLAILEIKNKCCPLIIIRKLPNGNIEKWSINELDILFDI